MSSRLQPSVVEVTPVDERIMRLRLKHSLGFVSVVAVYAPTEVCAKFATLGDDVAPNK